MLILDDEKKTINSKVMVYFDTVVDNLLYDHVMYPNSYLKTLRDVVNCTRKSMENTQIILANEFSLDYQSPSVPLELLSLIAH